MTSDWKDITVTFSRPWIIQRWGLPAEVYHAEKLSYLYHQIPGAFHLLSWTFDRAMRCCGDLINSLRVNIHTGTFSGSTAPSDIVVIKGNKVDASAAWCWWEPRMFWQNTSSACSCLWHRRLKRRKEETFQCAAHPQREGPWVCLLQVKGWSATSNDVFIMCLLWTTFKEMFWLKTTAFIKGVVPLCTPPLESQTSVHASSAYCIFSSPQAFKEKCIVQYPLCCMNACWDRRTGFLLRVLALTAIRKTYFSLLSEKVRKNTALMRHQTALTT